MLFVSKRKNHQLWIRPRKEHRLKDGTWVVDDTGLLVEFQNGLYETDDSDIINSLFKNNEYGLVFQVYNNVPPDKTDLVTTPVGFNPIQMEYLDDGRTKVHKIPLENPVIKENVRRGIVENDYQLLDEALNKPKNVLVPPLTDDEVIQRKLEGKRSFSCKTCGLMFTSPFEVVQHRKTAH
jgi:hypothetical protein